MQHTYDKLVDPEQLKHIFSDNLIYFMHTNHVSFEELSMTIDVSALAIRKWVDGISLPRLEHVYALALATRTPIESWLTMGGGGIMSNKIHYQCSNCGKREQTSAWVGIPEGMFHLGYRAHGDVMYCPDCVKTWKERNGEEYDEQYKDAQHLFAAWWNRQVQMQIGYRVQIADRIKIKTYRRNCIGDFVEVEE